MVERMSDDEEIMGLNPNAGSFYLIGIVSTPTGEPKWWLSNFDPNISTAPKIVKNVLRSKRFEKIGQFLKSIGHTFKLRENNVLDRLSHESASVCQLVFTSNKK